jgi:Na+-driven multidrug efflux pump
MVYVFHLGMYGVWFGLMTGNVVSGIVAWLWTTSALGGLESGRLTVART